MRLVLRALVCAVLVVVLLENRDSTLPMAQGTAFSLPPVRGFSG